MKSRSADNASYGRLSAIPSPAQQTSAGKIEDLLLESLDELRQLGLEKFTSELSGYGGNSLSRLRLKELLDGRTVVKGLELKPLDRWRISTYSWRWTIPDAAALVRQSGSAIPR
jgi:hypothetical protein